MSGSITVWVNDLMLFASNDAMMEHMKKSIESKWQATDLGEPSKIIGIKITFMLRSLRISQQKYIKNLLRKEKMAEANLVSMPLDPNIQYLANTTRPDISYAVNKLGSYTANLSLEHYRSLKRILRYLAGTKDFGITSEVPR